MTHANMSDETCVKRTPFACLPGWHKLHVTNNDVEPIREQCMTFSYQKYHFVLRSANHGMLISH